MSLLITLLVICVVFYLIYWVLGQTPVPQPIKNVIYIVLAIFAIIYLFGLLPGGSVLVR